MSYGKIERKIWHSRDFKSLSENGRALVQYLLTCPHGNLQGLFILPFGYAISDLQWTKEEFEQAFLELIDRGFIKYDRETEIVLITKFLKYNPFQNPSVVTHALNLVQKFPVTPLFIEYKKAIIENHRNTGNEEMLTPIISYLDKVSTGCRQGVDSMSTTEAVTVTETKEPSKHLGASKEGKKKKKAAPPRPLKKWDSKKFMEEFDPLAKKVRENMGTIGNNKFPYDWAAQKISKGWSPEIIIQVTEEILKSDLSDVKNPFAYFDAVWKTKAPNMKSAIAEKDHEKYKEDMKNGVEKLAGKVFKDL